jgi:hypothetical protein
MRLKSLLLTAGLASATCPGTSDTKDYEYVIIGSGGGGGTLAYVVF